VGSSDAAGNCEAIQSSVGWRPKSVESLDFTRARSKVEGLLLIIIKYLMETEISLKTYHKKRRNQK
jgi:hypothetical protein